MLYGLLNLLRAMSQKQRKRGILQRRLQSLLGFRGYVLSLFSILRAQRDRCQPRLDQFRFIKIHTCFRWGIKQKKLLLSLKMISLLLFPQVWISIHRNWSISVGFVQWYTLSQCGVSRGPYLDPLLFMTYTCKLFWGLALASRLRRIPKLMTGCPGELHPVFVHGWEKMCCDLFNYYLFIYLIAVTMVTILWKD